LFVRFHVSNIRVDIFSIMTLFISFQNIGLTRSDIKQL